MVSNIHDTTFFIKHIQDFFFPFFTFFPQPPTSLLLSLLTDQSFLLFTESPLYVGFRFIQRSLCRWSFIAHLMLRWNTSLFKKEHSFYFQNQQIPFNGWTPILLKCCGKATGIHRHMGLQSQLRLLLWFDFTFRRKLSVPFISLADRGTEHNMLNRNIRNGIKSAKMFSFIQTKRKKEL